MTFLKHRKILFKCFVIPTYTLLYNLIVKGTVYLKYLVIFFYLIFRVLYQFLRVPYLSKNGIFIYLCGPDICQSRVIFSDTDKNNRVEIYNFILRSQSYYSLRAVLFKFLCYQKEPLVWKSDSHLADFLNMHDARIQTQIYISGFQNLKTNYLKSDGNKSIHNFYTSQ